MQWEKPLFIIILSITLYLIYTLYVDTHCDADQEDFGALQSLYSNDGIQDQYLTIENDPRYFDPYRYWRGIPWNLPTRDLNRVGFYPYLYEHYVDRYGVLYPYW